MSIDFRRSQPFSATVIKGETIHAVTNYKYLGTVLVNKLKWDGSHAY